MKKITLNGEIADGKKEKAVATSGQVSGKMSMAIFINVTKQCTRLKTMGRTTKLHYFI